MSGQAGLATVYVGRFFQNRVLRALPSTPCDGATLRRTNEGAGQAKQEDESDSQSQREKCKKRKEMKKETKAKKGRMEEEERENKKGKGVQNGRRGKGEERKGG
jgi:hypothetical protein